MIVDSDIIIWYARGNQKARKLLDANRGFFISSVTYIELVQGMKNKRELKAFKETLHFWQTKVIQINETVSTKAMFYVEHYFLSHAMHLADALIGATAVVHHLPLFTGNVKHYTALKELDLRKFSH